MSLSVVLRAAVIVGATALVALGQGMDSTPAEDDRFFALLHAARAESSANFRSRSKPTLLVATFNEGCWGGEFVMLSNTGDVRTSSVPALSGSLTSGMRRLVFDSDEVRDLRRLAVVLPKSEARGPLSKRLVVRTLSAEGWTERSYDRNRLPKPVLELLNDLAARVPQVKAAFVERFEGERVCKIDVQRPDSTSFTFAPDGALCIQVDSGSTIRAIDLRTTNSVARIETRTDPSPLKSIPVRVQFSPNGRFLSVVRHSPTTIRVFGTEKWEVVFASNSNTGEGHLLFSPNGKWALVELGGATRHLSTATWEEIGPPFEVPAGARVLALDRRARRAIGHLPDRSVRLFSNRSGTPSTSVLRKAEWAKAKFSVDDSMVAVASSESEGSLRILDTRATETALELRAYGLGRPEITVSMAWSSDSRYLVTSSVAADRRPSNHRLHVWDSRSGSHVADLVGPTGKIRELAFVEDEETLLAAGEHGEVHRWNWAKLVSVLNDESNNSE